MPQEGIHTQKPPDRIHYKEIAELEESLRQILEELRPHLEKNEYRLIVGDDASGRIPTLIMRKVIDEIYGKLGYLKPRILFVAGGVSPFLKLGERKMKKMSLLLKEKILSRFDSGEDVKALLVTDTISTGSTLEMFRKVFGSVGLSFDVAAVGMDASWRDPEETKQMYKNNFGIEIFWGGEDVPPLYYNKDLSGVEKQPEDVFAKAQPSERLVYESEDDDVGIPNLEMRKKSRKDVNVLVKRLLDAYYR